MEAFLHPPPKVKMKYNVFSTFSKKLSNVSNAQWGWNRTPPLIGLIIITPSPSKATVDTPACVSNDNCPCLDLNI